MGLYLCHDDKITIVNPKDHYYCDVTHPPMEEFNLASLELMKSGEEKLIS